MQQVGRLLREHQRGGAGARVRQATNHDVAAPHLPGADRDLPARLPQVELAERPRPIRGALEAARPRQKQGSHLAHVVIEDRLAARVALLLQKLPQPLARQPRIGAQQPVDLLAERVQLRRPQPPPIPGRLSRAQRPPDRVTAVAGAPDDLLDRQPLHKIQAADLRPLLHPDHNLLLARHVTTQRGSRPPRTAPRAPPRGQLSTGVRGSVSNRRRYLTPIATRRSHQRSCKGHPRRRLGSRLRSRSRTRMCCSRRTSRRSGTRRSRIWTSASPRSPRASRSRATRTRRSAATYRPGTSTTSDGRFARDWATTVP